MQADQKGENKTIMPECNNDQNNCEELKEKYYREDKFPCSLGIEVAELTPGYCRAEMKISDELTNFHGITHGGALFSLADTAFGLASNSRGVVAVALQVSINYMSPSVPGEKLEAIASEVSLTRSTGVYDVQIQTGDGKVVAIFRGVVYRKQG